MPISPSERDVILRSLTAGVTPSTGLRHILVGRRRELGQILAELKVTAAGGSGCKLIAGDFGSGKTFLLGIVRQLAAERDFVTAHADFSPHAHLYGAGRGLATYRALTARFATRAFEHDALERILEHWLNQLQRAAALECETGADTRPTPPHHSELPLPSALEHRSEGRLASVLAPLDGLPGGYDFVNVLLAYWRGLARDDAALRRAAVRWLRGEYATKTEAHRDLLSVRSILTDDSWRDALALWARFFTLIGYSGLLIVLDEGVNLYKITHPQSRAKNYEVLLGLFNDANQGRLPGLYALIGTTPEAVTDERRGLYSYSALKSRLAPNPFAGREYKDMAQPLIELDPLAPEELVVLLRTVRDLHGEHYGYAWRPTDEQVIAFVETFLNRPGADRFGTARECVRRFLSALNLLQQNPELEPSELFGQTAARAADDAEAAALTTETQPGTDPDADSDDPDDAFVTLG